MAIVLGVDELITLGDAAKHFGCVPKTAWLYATRGVRWAGGLKLETKRVGGRHMTTVRCCEEFATKLEQLRQRRRADAAGAAGGAA